MKSILKAPMPLFQGRQKIRNNSLAILLMMFSLAAQAKEWTFDVYLDKQKIGIHTFELKNNVLKSQANFKVKILFINVYEYHHTAVEQWDKDCLVKLKAYTKEDDVTYNVFAEKSDGGFGVTYNQITRYLPVCTMTFAYWNPKILQQTRLLNPQNAEYLDTKIKDLGNKIIAIQGKPTATQHYEILGSIKGKPKLNIQVWYDENHHWVSLKSTTPEGYHIYYKLKE